MWLYVPRSTSSPYAPASADLTSDSVLRNPRRARFVSWRGKRMRRQRLSAEWKKGGWIRHLSGLTLERSTAARGVEKFLASLPATRANRSATPGSGGERTTPATCGPTSPAPSARSGPSSVYSRMSPGICDWGSGRSQRNFNEWATALLRACSLREKLVLRTAATAYLLCPTPTVMSDGDATANRGISLPRKARNWSTPRASPNENRNTKHAPSHGKSHGKSLAGEIQEWGTPTSHERSHAKRKVHHGRQLANQTGTWGIPTVRDYKDEVNPTPAVQSKYRLGLQAPRSGIGGNTSSESPRVLNPLFVEWLMGWPRGWTASAVAETEWSRWWRRMRGEYSRTVSVWLRAREIDRATGFDIPDA